MANDNRPSSFHADDFDLLSTGDQIIIQARGGQTELRARDADGNDLDIANLAGDLGIDLEEDGAVLVADAPALNFTGDGVDATDDGDGTATLTVTDTHTDVSDGGVAVLGDVAAIDFGANVAVTDNGDGTVTVDGTVTDTRRATAIQTTQLQDTEYISKRLRVPNGSTLNVYAAGVQTTDNTIPAGLTAEVDDETNAVNLVSRNAKRATADPLATVDGPVDVAFRAENNTGDVQNANADFEYELV